MPTEITTKVDGNSSVVVRYGPGSGGNSRPELGRWMKITNSSSQASPLFENTETEKNSMYSNIGSASNISVKFGQYGVSTTLYNNTSAMAVISGAPCWSPSTPSATYATPPACPSGFSDGGVTNTRNASTFQTVGQAGVNHTDQPWMFYQYAGFVCPSPFVANISVRNCTA